MTVIRWTTGILAVWLAFSAFLGFTVVGNVLNLLTVGVIIAGVGVALIEYSKWQGWTSTLAGLWLVAALFIPALRSGSGLMWNSVIVAAAVLAASLPLPGEREAALPRAPRPDVPPEQEPSVPAEPWEEAEHEERDVVHR